MPKNKKSETESSESETDSSSREESPEPAPKKSKTEASKKDKKSKSESKSEDKKAKSSKNATGPWVLEGLRQVSISEFRGRKSVDIREFYMKDGETLPGKKGIALSITQWLKLLEVAEEVTAAVRNQ